MWRRPLVDVGGLCRYDSVGYYDGSHHLQKYFDEMLRQVTSAPSVLQRFLRLRLQEMPAMLFASPLLPPLPGDSATD